MGQGAYVKIINMSGQPVEVGYWGINCMYQNGENGSDFGPITTPAGSDIPSGSMLPLTGTQYLEAIASGGCASETSTFNMNFNIGPESDQKSATFYFSESSQTYRVATTANGSAGAFATQSANGATFDVFVVHDYNGDQDLIVATVYV